MDVDVQFACMENRHTSLENTFCALTGVVIQLVKLAECMAYYTTLSACKDLPHLQNR